MEAQSERLILRKMTMNDDKGMFELDSNPNVMKYILGIPPLTDIEQSRNIIRYAMNQYELHGMGRMAVELKATGEFIGWAGIKYITETYNEQTNFYDLGYRFIERFWGNGYGYEAAKLALDYGFETLNLTKISGFAMVDNKGSNHILQKVGLSNTNSFEASGFECLWYEKSL
jgi:[ribosomal protein S5]-alanine N-acetyltransferase